MTILCDSEWKYVTKDEKLIHGVLTFFYYLEPMNNEQCIYLQTRSTCIRFSALLVIFADNLVKALETSNTLDFGSNCPGLTEMNENQQFYVMFGGGKARISCDYFEFRGRMESAQDSYKICIIPQYFFDPSCAVSVKYTSTANGNTLESLNCTQNFHLEFCGALNQQLYIYLDRVGGVSTRDTRFKLLVHVLIKANDTSWREVTVGVAVVLAFIIILVASCCKWRWKKCPTQQSVAATTQTHQTNLELQRRTPFTSPANNIDRGVINRWSGPPPEYSVSSSAERSRTNATESMYQTSQINTAENTYGPSANYQRNPGFLLRYTPSTNPDPPPEYSVSCTAGRTVPSEFRDSRDPTVCHQTTESQCCDPPPSYEEAVNSS